MSYLSINSDAVLADIAVGSMRRGAAIALPVLAGVGLTALAAQVAIYLPGNPVPITGQTFGVLVVGAALGPIRAGISMLLYVAAAVVGLPVLAPGHGGLHATGWAVLHLATFGYLVGFVVAGALLGLGAKRGLDRRPWTMAPSFLIGSGIIYLFGATWLAVSLHLSAATAWSLGVRPFLIGDLIKAVLASAVLPIAWRLVNRATK